MRRAAACALALAFWGGCEPLPDDDEIPAQVVFPIWANQQRRPTSSPLRAVRFLDENVGYVAGADTSIFRTADGGATWLQLEHSPRSRGGDVAAMDLFWDGETLHVGTAGADAVSGGRWWTSGDGINFTTPDAASTGFAAMTAVDLTAPGTAYYLAQDGAIRRVTPSSETSFGVGAPGPWLALAFPGTGGIGYATGGGGAIRKTSTDGASWFPLASGTSAALRDLCFVSTAEGYACGDGGAVVRTVDGAGWADVSVGAAVTLRGVHFVDALKGWVVGDKGFIRRTVDGGASWGAPAASAASCDLYDVWFVNASVGYAVGDAGTVVKTVDGGVNWTEVSRGSLARLNAVDFTSDGVKGLAVGEGGAILRTLDGGANWTASPSGVTADLWGVSVPDAGSGSIAYACGAGGTILRTTDFGASWTAAASGVTATLRAILFPGSDSFGYCVGDGSTILTTSGGTSWTARTAPAAADFYCLGAPYSGFTAYAGGTGGRVIMTDLGGAFWYDRPIDGATATVVSLQSPLGTGVFAAASDGKVYRSLLSGQAGSWEALVPPSAPNGIAFTGGSSGWGVGAGIFFTENGGASWSPSFEHTSWTLRAVWMGSGGLGYVVGDNGTALKTRTGGK